MINQVRAQRVRTEIVSAAADAHDDGILVETVHGNGTFGIYSGFLGNGSICDIRGRVANFVDG